MKGLVAAVILLPVLGASAGTGSFSDFAWFFSEPSTSGYYWDGFVSDGPFMANGPISIWSSSPGRDGDPWFYSLTLASPFYYCSPGTGSNPQTTPQCGDLWIEPYEMMVQGPPWFVLGAEPIPFGADSVAWQETRDAAVAGGVYFGPGTIPNNTRMLLREDTLLIRVSNGSSVQEYDLTDLDENVIWIDNSPADRIYLKSYPCDSLAIPVTIGMNGSIYIMGPLETATVAPDDGMLGIVTLYGNLVVALDPDCVGGSDWTDPVWRIDTMDDFRICASMLSLEGVLLAQNPHYPNPAVDLTISGSVQSVTEGIMIISFAGFLTEVEYDWRLAGLRPPHYPQFIETGVEGGPGDPGGMLEMIVAANPFSSSLGVTIEGSCGPFTYEVYDLLGRLVADAVSGDRSIEFDGSSLPSGVLILRVSTGSDSARQRLVHIR